MNRKQEVVLWLLGLLLAYLAFDAGFNEGDRYVQSMVPPLIVGLLLLFSLRTRA